MTTKGAKTHFQDLNDSGTTPVGMFVGCMEPAMAEILGFAGYDFLIIDGEHSPMGPNEMLPMVRSTELANAVPLVRVWQNDRALIQKVLEIGAEGIVVPHIDTAEQAATAVASTRFAPHGTRSMCPTNHASRYSIDYWPTHVAHSANNVLVIPILESQTAIDNVDEILAVDGIDYVLFGPGDYSVDVGIAMDDPQVGAAWLKTLEAAKRAGKFTMTTDNVPGLAAGQANAVIQGMDLMHVSEMATTLRESARARLTAPAV